MIISNILPVCTANPISGILGIQASKAPERAVMVDVKDSKTKVYPQNYFRPPAQG